jgi:ELWxxDGT repeat protein
MWLHRRAAHLLLLISALGTPLLARGQQSCNAVPELVKDGGGNPIRDPANLVNVGGTLFFTLGAPGPGVMLWKSNGTPAGTVRMQPTAGWVTDASLSHFTAVDTRLYFAASSPVVANSDELCTSDGTNSGTQCINSFNLGGLGLQSEFVATTDALFFSGDYPGEGFEPWLSRGNRDTTQIVEVREGSPGSSPSSLTVMNNELFFVADDGSTDDELWKSTGPGNVTRITNINSNGPSLATSLTVMGDMLYFTATDGTGVTLWKSNGSDVTVKVAPGTLSCSAEAPSNLTAVGNKLFFRCADSAFGAELWVTDGTEAGTRRVKDIHSGSNGSDPHNLVAVGDTLFFVATDGAHGAEPWRSDGTEAGTRLVRDFYPGSSTPSEPKLVAGAGVLLAQITDNVSGSELWKIDAAGETRLTGTAPMAANSSPRLMTVAGDKLYFVATDPSLGNVLYMLPLKQVDCVLPELTCPPNQVVEAVSSEGAYYESLPYRVTDDAVAAPEVDGKGQLKGLFKLGVTPIALQAHDGAGNFSAPCSFNITVQDKTPPHLVCPGPVVQEATGPKTQSFFFVAASDAVTSKLALDYHGHPPGSDFEPGPTPVKVTVIDEALNTAECNFQVIVDDTVPPRITCPLDIVQEATSADPIPVSYTYQVEDVGTPEPELITEHPSGSDFSVGETEVTLTARDKAGREGSCTFLVKIADKQPPTLTCPKPKPVAATQPGGAEVDFEAVPADNLGAELVNVEYSQSPKTLFPVGETLVTATATDKGNNSVSCTFTVTVSEYIASDGACQAGGSGGALGWLLLVLMPVWARRRAGRVAR